MEDFYNEISGLGSETNVASKFAYDKHIASLPEEKDTLGTQAKTIIDQTWTSADIVKGTERYAGGIIEDESFELDRETVNEINRIYNEKESEYLRESTSKEMWLQRQVDVENDREATEVLGRMGLMKSVPAMLVASVVDPVNLATLGGSGLISAAKNFSRVGKTLFTAGVVGLENAGLEAIHYSVDSQARIEDIAYASMFGGLLGAGFGAMGKVNPKAADDIADAELSLREDAANTQVREVAPELRKSGHVRSDIAEAVGPDGDSVRVQQDIRQMEATMKAEAELKLKPKEIDDLLEELSYIEGRRAEIDKVGNVDPAKTTTPNAERIADLDAETRALDQQARDIEAKLDGHTRAVDSAKFKKKWKSWSTKKKIERLYDGKTPPNKRMVAESQRDSVVEVERGNPDLDKSQVTPDNRKEVMAEASNDSRFKQKMDKVVGEADDLKLKIRQDIEERFGCKVSI